MKRWRFNLVFCLFCLAMLLSVVAVSIAQTLPTILISIVVMFGVAFFGKWLLLNKL